MNLKYTLLYEGRRILKIIYCTSECGALVNTVWVVSSIIHQMNFMIIILLFTPLPPKNSFIR